MTVGGIFSAFKTTMRGLSTQMKKMELISENMANADKVPDENGEVYQRKVLSFKTAGGGRQSRFSSLLSMRLRTSQSGHIASPAATERNTSGLNKTKYKVLQQEGEQLVFNPDHPRADEKGYVRMPNVNVVEEMVDMISTSRSYEANITVMEGAKQMAKKALDI